MEIVVSSAALDKAIEKLEKEYASVYVLFVIGLLWQLRAAHEESETVTIKYEP